MTSDKCALYPALHTVAVGMTNTNCVTTESQEKGSLVSGTVCCQRCVSWNSECEPYNTVN